MHKIIFRGMTKGEEWWVNGYPIKKDKIYGIIPFSEICYTDNGECLDFNYVEVIPHTIGQYIGIKEDYEKIGKMIFVGDRVEMVFVDEDRYGITFAEEAIVAIDERTNQVGFQSDKYYKGFAPLGHYTDNCNAESIKVIGTIFDKGCE